MEQIADEPGFAGLSDDDEVQAEPVLDPRPEMTSPRESIPLDDLMQQLTAIAEEHPRAVS